MRGSRPQLDTPICLDESLVSAAGTADAIELGACEIANIKPGRVGGYLEAVRIHDLCSQSGRARVVRRHVGDGHRSRLRTLRSLRSRVSRCRATSVHRPASMPRTSSTDRSRSPTATSRCRPVPGLGFELDRVFLDAVTTSTQSLDLSSPRPFAKCGHTASLIAMTHLFLSEEWMTAARAIREKYADQVPEVGHQHQDQSGHHRRPVRRRRGQQLPRHVVRCGRRWNSASSTMPTPRSPPTTTPLRRCSSIRIRRSRCRRSWPARSRCRAT